MTRNIFIVGAGGMLGTSVVKQFEGHHRVLATDAECDVRDFAAVKRLADRFKPDVVINLAALTSLEQCETFPEDAMAINATTNLAAVALGADATYMYVSSGEIFCDDKDFNSDDDAPNPQSVYAKTKYLGELIAASVPKHYIVRAAWMMGGGIEKDKKFLNQIFKQLGQGRTSLSVVNDIVGTPTYTVDFAKGLDVILDKAPYGAYNQANTGCCTRYEMAVEFVRLLGLQDKVSVKATTSPEKSLRHLRQCLRNDKLDALGLNIMRDWRVALEEYSKEFTGEKGIHSNLFRW